MTTSSWFTRIRMDFQTHAQRTCWFHNRKLSWFYCPTPNHQFVIWSFRPNTDLVYNLLQGLMVALLQVALQLCQVITSLYLILIDHLATVLNLGLLQCIMSSTNIHSLPHSMAASNTISLFSIVYLDWLIRWINIPYLFSPLSIAGLQSLAIIISRAIFEPSLRIRKKIDCVNEIEEVVGDLYAESICLIFLI